MCLAVLRSLHDGHEFCSCAACSIFSSGCNAGSRQNSVTMAPHAPPAVPCRPTQERLVASREQQSGLRPPCKEVSPAEDTLQPQEATSLASGEKSQATVWLFHSHEDADHDDTGDGTEDNDENDRPRFPIADFAQSKQAGLLRMPCVWDAISLVLVHCQPPVR